MASLEDLERRLAAVEERLDLEGGLRAVRIESGVRQILALLNQLSAPPQPGDTP